MEMLLAFLVGVASSAVVAYLVYKRQRRESLQTESALLQRLTEHGEDLGLVTSTTLMVADSAARLERDVSILRRQLTSALDTAETLRDDQLAMASDLLPKNGMLDERSLKELHRLLLSQELDYAGEFRDVAVRVGGEAFESGSAVVAPEPAELQKVLGDVLKDWNGAVTAEGSLSRDEWLDRIARFHAGLISIHPFFDGNGVVARILLALQTEKHLGLRLVLPRRDPTYFASIRKASEGDPFELFSYLKSRIEAAAQQAATVDGASRRN
jgi:fido (protein-threonine AMPylation protein)